MNFVEKDRRKEKIDEAIIEAKRRREKKKHCRNIRQYKNTIHTFKEITEESTKKGLQLK